MRLFKLFLFGIFLVAFWSCSDLGDPEIKGCTDDTACNYNQDATEDDGSCVSVDGICETCVDGTIIDNDADNDDVCDVSYSKIQQIFTNNCSGCHIGGTSGGLNLSVDFSYDNLVNVTSQNYSPALRVAPGSSENSVLYNKISNTGIYGGAMPQGGSGLSSSNSELIEKWINEGAQDN